jgi:amidase
MESISPIARSVEDVAILYRALAGPDGFDWTVPPVSVGVTAPPPLAGLRIAVAEAFPGERVQQEVRDTVQRLAHTLADEGAIVETTLPDVDWEAQRALRRRLFAAADRAFADPSSERAMTLRDYLSALDARASFIAAWERFFDAWPVLLVPTTNRTAFEHRRMGEAYDIDGATADYWTVERHVQPINLTGGPALSLPAGMDRDGLPIGVQLIAGRWRDEWLLAVAKRIEPLVGGFARPPRLA